MLTGIMGSFLAQNDTQLEKMLYRLLGKYYSFGIHRMENTQNYRDAAEMTSYLKGPGKKKKKKLPVSSEILRVLPVAYLPYLCT